MFDFYVEMRQHGPERRPDVVRKRLKFLLSLPDEGIQIVLPILIGLMKGNATRRQSLDLLDAIGGRLGPVLCNK